MFSYADPPAQPGRAERLRLVRTVPSWVRRNAGSYAKVKDEPHKPVVPKSVKFKEAGRPVTNRGLFYRELTTFAGLGEKDDPNKVGLPAWRVGQFVSSEMLPKPKVVLPIMEGEAK